MNSCRLCGQEKLQTLLDLGEHPIAHRYLNSRQDEEYVHPFIVCFCDNCGLIQLDNPIPPDLLYSNFLEFIRY